MNIHCGGQALIAEPMMPSSSDVGEHLNHAAHQPDGAPQRVVGPSTLWPSNAEGEGGGGCLRYARTAQAHPDAPASFDRGLLVCMRGVRGSCGPKSLVRWD